MIEKLQYVVIGLLGGVGLIGLVLWAMDAYTYKDILITGLGAIIAMWGLGYDNQS